MFLISLFKIKFELLVYGFILNHSTLNAQNSIISAKQDMYCPRQQSPIYQSHHTFLIAWPIIIRLVVKTSGYQVIQQ